MSETLRILVCETREGFVAQCLERDICTQAPTLEVLRERMESLIELELAEADESGQAQAPEYFCQMWDKVETVESGSPQ